MTEKKNWHVQQHRHLDAKTGSFIDTQLHKGCVLIKTCTSKKLADDELRKLQA